MHSTLPQDHSTHEAASSPSARCAVARELSGSSPALARRTSFGVHGRHFEADLGPHRVAHEVDRLDIEQIEQADAVVHHLYAVLFGVHRLVAQPVAQY